MWVRMRKVSMYFNVQSERFFLVHRSSLRHLKAILQSYLKWSVLDDQSSKRDGPPWSTGSFGFL